MTAGFERMGEMDSGDEVERRKVQKLFFFGAEFEIGKEKGKQRLVQKYPSLLERVDFYLFG